VQAKNPSTRSLPIIRVFVSSTFSDLKHERNELQRKVFPKLEQLCLQRGFQFQAIDLRWGVPTEAGLDHRTMRICFEELRRAQEISPEPNFLILLGDRYGWRPLPEAISVGQFNELKTAAAEIDSPTMAQTAVKSDPKQTIDLEPRLSGSGVEAPLPDGRGSTTLSWHSSSATSVLEQWYLRDDNNIPPVHVLRSRIGTACELDKQAWMKIEDVLWAIINKAYSPETMDSDRFHLKPMSAMDRFGQPPFPEIVRFQASATEQEIWGGALAVEHPEQHVLACFRQIRNRDSFSPDTNLPDGAGDFLSVTDNRLDARLGQLQEQLKSELRNRLEAAPARPPEQSRCFHMEDTELSEVPNTQGDARWDVTLTDEYKINLQAMCDWVERRFTTIINGQIDAYLSDSPTATPSPRETPLTQASSLRALQIEREAHQRFADERAPVFVVDEESVDGVVGRQQETQDILDYLFRDDSRLLVVHGVSGSGKTALLARAAREAVREAAERKLRSVVARRSPSGFNRDDFGDAFTGQELCDLLNLELSTRLLGSS